MTQDARAAGLRIVSVWRRPKHGPQTISDEDALELGALAVRIVSDCRRYHELHREYRGYLYTRTDKRKANEDVARAEEEAAFLRRLAR